MSNQTAMVDQTMRNRMGLLPVHRALLALIHGEPIDKRAQIKINAAFARIYCQCYLLPAGLGPEMVPRRVLRSEAIMSAKREHRISQSGFARLQEILLKAELDGYGPDAAAANALRSIGLQPEPYIETVFVVDPMLDAS